MKDVLDELEFIKPNNNYYVRTIFLHSTAILIFLFLLWIFRLNVSELIFNVLDLQIHLIGVLIFAGLIANSIIVAKKLSRDQNNFSNYRIALAGGISFFIGDFLYGIMVRVFYIYVGVYSEDILHFLITSFMLFTIGLLYTLIRIKKIRKEKRRIENLILILLYFGIGYVLTN